MRRLAVVALALGFLGLSFSAKADEKCRLVRVAALDMGSDATRITVPASIGGQPLTMMVDTGGIYTMLLESRAKALGAFVDVEPSSGLSMYGGHMIRHFAKISGFTLGRMKAPALPYPLLPDGALPPGVDGLLSPDFLANFDVDFDFVNAKLNLFSRDHCEGKVVYWTHDPVAVIPFERNEVNDIEIRVQLDGQDVKALIDTGGDHSVMSLESAEGLFDLKEDALKRVPGPNGTHGARRYPFKQLSFANVTVSNPDITLVPDRESQTGPRGPELIIGMSILRQLHLYIAYGEKKLYLSAASAH
ncbi:MAG: retropepsin-like domain-containing protein [Alphaproteobacteria bacterium]|nr:retropepsin-like domain-containing protein [Alphaproteobacteria bacterium]